jgi:hypothetical protein
MGKLHVCNTCGGSQKDCVKLFKYFFLLRLLLQHHQTPLDMYDILLNS